MTCLTLLALLMFAVPPDELDTPSSQPASRPVDEPAESQPEVPPPPPPPVATPLRAGAKPMRLMIRPADVARLRDRCGTGVAVPPGGAGLGDVGARAAEFQQLLTAARRITHGPADFGALYPVAFAHLVGGKPGEPDEFTRYVEQALTTRDNFLFATDDVAAALDWCWGELSPKTRQATAEQLVANLQPLAATDSPFEHALFHQKLCSLAAAIVLRGAWPTHSPEADKVDQAYEAGRAYLNGTLASVIRQTGGLAPTPAERADFEADLVFALELWQSIEPTAWNSVREPMSRALDVYLWADTAWPSLRTGIMHDTGSSSPLRPGTGENALAPAVADILARRTTSPVAAYYARANGTQGTPTLRDTQRLWLRILHASAEPRPVQVPRAPLARALGNGWVYMRSDWREGATLLAFDAGQALWGSRQHLDAGQFQIIRRGRLAIDSGDDVLVVATPGQGGQQGLGDQPGSFDLYARSTIAHNCVVVIPPNEAPRRVGRVFVAQGNQRQPAERLTKFDVDVSTSDWAAGRLIAFDTNAFFSFAAADLAKAYGVKNVLVYERAVLFIHDGVVVVMDRVEATSPQAARYWVLHLPEAPRIGGAPLDSAFRRRAERNDAGSWVYPPSESWLSTQSDGGRLFVRTVLPVERRWHLIGGPNKPETIGRGLSRGRAYLGSNARGFEYWMSPAAMNGGLNAWYRLGEPGVLGDAFGLGGGWGRLEVEASAETTSTVFVNLLVPCDVSQNAPPKVEPTVDDEQFRLRVTLAGRQYVVRLALRETASGEVTVDDASGKPIFSRKLSGQVTSPPALPTD